MNTKNSPDFVDIEGPVNDLRMASLATWSLSSTIVNYALKVARENNRAPMVSISTGEIELLHWMIGDIVSRTADLKVQYYDLLEKVPDSPEVAAIKAKQAARVSRDRGIAA